MRNKAGLVVPLLMILMGAYALLTAFNGGGEQVTLISDHSMPRGLAIMIGVIGLAGGVLVMLSMFGNRRSAA